MKKLVYISPDCFFDVDFPVLKSLVRYYDIIWYPIIAENEPRYNEEYIRNFAQNSKINIKIWLRKGRRRDLKQLFFSFKLLRSVRNEKADIVYTEYTGDLFFSFLSLLLLKRRNTFIAIHDAFTHVGFSSKFEIISNRLAQHYFKYFHLFSKSQKSIFDTLFPKKSSYFAPLALKNFGNDSHKRPSKENVCKFLFFGMIDYYKGLDILIMAIERLQARNIGNIKLTIAGKGQGEYWNSCMSLIKSRSIYDLIINYIPDEDIPNLFAESHFLVLPYRDVTQSGPLMIAMNYSLPVIAADFPGFSEFIEKDKTGFLFNNGSCDSLINQLIKCINLTNEEYNQITTNIDEYCNIELNIENIVQKYVSFFETVRNT